MTSLFGGWSKTGDEAAPAATPAGNSNPATPASVADPTTGALAAAADGGGGGTGDGGADAEAGSEEDGELGTVGEHKRSEDAGHMEHFPLDALPQEMRQYYTSQELAEHLALRVFQPFHDEKPACVYLIDLERDADGRAEENNEADESTAAEIQKHREVLAGNTLKHDAFASSKYAKLTAVRIAQIERRLLLPDPSIVINDEPLDRMEPQAKNVREQLRRTYGKIKRHSFDLSESHRMHIDQKISILKDV